MSEGYEVTAAVFGATLQKVEQIQEAIASILDIAELDYSICINDWKDA